MSGFENLSERDRAVLRSIFDPTATIGDVADDGDEFTDDEDDATETDKESKSLCREGVQLAEAGKLEEAMKLLDKGVESSPLRASSYNDRAQLLRLMKRDDDAMADLEKVLQLTDGKGSRVRALAFCQRGVLQRGRGADDAARRDFSEAAKLGSGFAKKQVVELNPYAALCNQMLSQVLRGEKDIKL